MGDLCLVGDKLSCVSSGRTTIESDLQRGSVNVSERRSAEFSGFCRGSPGSNSSLAGQILH